MRAEAGKQWRAPALSSLVSRLAQPPFGVQPHPGPSARPHPEQDQHYLEPSSDEEEAPAAAASEVEGSSAGGGGGLSIYSAAAGPLKALLACIAAEPGCALVNPC